MRISRPPTLIAGHALPPQRKWTPPETGVFVGFMISFRLALSNITVSPSFAIKRYEEETGARGDLFPQSRNF